MPGFAVRIRPKLSDSALVTRGLVNGASRFFVLKTLKIGATSSSLLVPPTGNCLLARRSTLLNWVESIWDAAC